MAAKTRPPADPLEQAKQQAKPPAAPAAGHPAGQLPLGQPAQAPAPPEVSPTPVPEKVVATPVGAQKPAPRYRVREQTTVSLGGQLCVLHKGDTVSESSYGPEHMARIRASNVPLEELPE